MKEIKANLKDTDRIKVTYNKNEVDMSISDFKNSLRGYKIYKALITQSGTDAPTAIVLENTLSGDLTWSYNTVGVYVATLAGEFTADKTFIFTGQVATDTVVSTNRINVDSITLRTYDISSAGLTDVRLSNNSIEIKVYD